MDNLIKESKEDSQIGCAITKIWRILPEEHQKAFLRFINETKKNKDTIIIESLDMQERNYIDCLCEKYELLTLNDTGSGYNIRLGLLAELNDLLHAQLTEIT